MCQQIRAAHWIGALMPGFERVHVSVSSSVQLAQQQRIHHEALILNNPMDGHWASTMCWHPHQPWDAKSTSYGADFLIRERKTSKSITWVRSDGDTSMVKSETINQKEKCKVLQIGFRWAWIGFPFGWWTLEFSHWWEERVSHGKIQKNRRPYRRSLRYETEGKASVGTTGVDKKELVEMVVGRPAAAGLQSTCSGKSLMCFTQTYSHLISDNRKMASQLPQISL